MKYIKIAIILFFLILTSCTDVVSVEVPFEGSRLVIEASLDWEKGTLGNEQTINLSLSSPFFDETAVVPVTGASVVVTNKNDGSVFVFNDENNGRYSTNTFIPKLNERYGLEIIYNDEVYIAEEKLFPLSGIESISHSIEGGVDPEAIAIEIFYQDPVDEENYYLISYQAEGDLFPFLDETSDEFRNGNLISDFYEKGVNQEPDEVKPIKEGDIIDIELFSISKEYHSYVRLLITQVQGGNNPFSPVPVTLKGNCVNITNPKNNPFGYFRVTESHKVSYTVQ